MNIFDKNESRIIDSCSLRDSQGSTAVLISSFNFVSFAGYYFLLWHVRLCFILGSMTGSQFSSFYLSTLPLILVSWDELPGATALPAMPLLSECDHLNRHYCHFLPSDPEIM